MSAKHIKYGAAGFRTKAAPSQINRFVRNLPSDKRQSLFQVAEELKSAGMIETTGKHTKTHYQGVLNNNASDSPYGNLSNNTAQLDD